MDSSFCFDTAMLGWSLILYISGGAGYNFQKYYILLSEYLFYLTNSVDPDEMQHYAAFDLGLHCLQKYLFKGFWNTKGKLTGMNSILDIVARSVYRARK